VDELFLATLTRRRARKKKGAGCPAGPGRYETDAKPWKTLVGLINHKSFCFSIRECSDLAQQGVAVGSISRFYANGTTLWFAIDPRS